MQTAMLQLMKAASHTIVLTIRLGESYVLKSNTATHSTTRFKRLLSNNGWKIAEDVPIFTKGWHVLKLEKVPR
jgi:hypothetical protein